MVAHTMQLPVRDRPSLIKTDNDRLKTAQRETGVPAGAPGTPIVSCGQTTHMRLAICRPAWWASCGFAAIPTTMLDPPHSAASPMVPALIGSGSP